MISAIIVAAGSSRRMGFDKLLAEVAGKPVIFHSIAAFARHEAIGELVVVTSAEKSERIAELTEEAAAGLPFRVVTGGAARQDSVRNGLEALAEKSELVAVHDGARPLIRAETISLCLEMARRHQAASCARRVTETIKRADSQGRVSASIDRENLWAMETPQCFSTRLLKGAYERVRRSGATVTDEVSAVEALGEPIYLVQNPHPNLKITFPPDLDLAARLLTFSP